MTLKGMDGAEKIQSMMNEMRNNPPKKIGAWDVLALRDYKERYKNRNRKAAK